MSPEPHFSLTIPGDPPIDAKVHSFDAPNERAYRSVMVGGHNQAREVWNAMDDEHRAALVSLVSEVLGELAQNPDEWLADGLTARDDELIGVSVLFRLGSLDAQIVRMRAEHQAAQQQRIADLQRMCANGTVATPA